MLSAVAKPFRQTGKAGGGPAYRGRDSGFFCAHGHPLAIGQSTQQREYLGQTVNLIEHHKALERA